MARKMSPQEPHVGVVIAARCGADQQAQLLAAIEILNRIGMCDRRSERGETDDGRQPELHGSLPGF
jgi:hypothetical protein